LYQQTGRAPYASINFITCHDGFTLQDLVSYNEKHNENNGEGNRDGANDNNSWNCGAEGETDDADICALRERQKRNFIATLLLSQGVPMLWSGDELSHSQQGNNNAYCHDDEITWLNWEIDDSKREFLNFVKRVLRVWREQPVLQRRKFFQGRSIRGSDIKDISWFEPAGQEMSDQAWTAGFVKCIGVRLAGDVIGDVDEHGDPIVGDTLLLLLNANHEAIPFTLPATRPEHHWEPLLDSAEASIESKAFSGGQRYPLQSRSLALLRTRDTDKSVQVLTDAQVDSLYKQSRRRSQRSVNSVLGSVT
jgi:glycogen operon protein